MSRVSRVRRPLSSHHILIASSALVAVMAANSRAASAQDARWDDEIPAHLYAVDGAVTLERDGYVEEAVENTILLPGDRLRTQRGRVEVLFADGSALDVDSFTSVDVLADSLLRLLEGRIRLAVTRNAAGSTYRVDAAPGSAWIRVAGDYRLALHQPGTANAELELAVLRGSAELVNALGRTLVRAGTFAVTQTATLPSLPYPLNSAAWDEFDQWTEDLHNSRLGMTSTSYLPADLRYYGGTLDRYGTWEQSAAYGNVWYPRVPVGWSPYATGRWSFTARFGWAWVGLDRWSWPTHHYGSWGVSASRWYWIPGRRWAPAWVSWGTAPGYVSWSPLGYNGRPLVGLNVSIRVGGARLGWTVVPSRVFATNIRVTRHVVPHHNLSTVWSGFNRRTTAPDVRAANGRVLRSPAGRSGTAVSRVPTRDRSRPASRTPPRTSAAPSGTNRSAPPRATRAPERATASGAQRRTGTIAPTRTTGTSPSRATAGTSRATSPRWGAPSRTRTTPPTAGRLPSSTPSRAGTPPPRASGAPPTRRRTPAAAVPSRSSGPSRTGTARPRTSGTPPARAGSSVGGRSGGSPPRSTAPSRTRGAPPRTPPTSSAGSSRGRSASPPSGGRGSAVRRTGGRGSGS